MINRGNRILILLHLYCFSKHKLSTILIANVANLNILIQNIIQAFWVFYLYILFMIGLLPLRETVDMNLAQLDMLYSFKKIVILQSYSPTTATSPQRPLSSVPKVAVVESFDRKSINQSINQSIIIINNNNKNQPRLPQATQFQSALNHKL